MDGKTGLVLDSDASSEQFATAIKQVKETPGLLDSMRKEARRRARDFDRKTSAETLLAAYARLLEHPSRPRLDQADVWLAIQEGFGAEWDLFIEKLAEDRIAALFLLQLDGGVEVVEHLEMAGNLRSLILPAGT